MIQVLHLTLFINCSPTHSHMQFYSFFSAGIVSGCATLECGQSDCSWFRELHVFVSLQLQMPTLKWFLLNLCHFFDGNSIEDEVSREIHCCITYSTQLFFFSNPSNLFLLSRNEWMNYLMGGWINVNNGFSSFTTFFERKTELFHVFLHIFHFE